MNKYISAQTTEEEQRRFLKVGYWRMGNWEWKDENFWISEREQKRNHILQAEEEERVWC